MAKARSLTSQVKRVVVGFAISGLLVTVPLGLVAFYFFEFVNSESDLKTSVGAVLSAHRSQILVGDTRSVEIQIRNELRLSPKDTALFTDVDLKRWLAGFDKSDVKTCKPLGSVCRDFRERTLRGFFPIYLDDQKTSLWGYLYIERRPLTDWFGALALTGVFCVGMLLQLAGLYVKLSGTLRPIMAAITGWSERLSRDPKASREQSPAPFSEFDPVEVAISKLNLEIAQLETIARKEGALEMLRGLGHDILNPVSRMKRILGVASRQGDSSAVFDEELYLGLQANLKRLSDYSEQLKILYKKQTGEFGAESRMTNVSDEVGALISELEFDPTVAEKNLKFEKDIKENCLASIAPSALSRVVENLCSNAVYASKSDGTIRIDVGATDHFVEISVRDFGCGIPLDLQNQIFESGFTSKENKGTGLGLFVVRQVCEQYGGRIEVKSKPGEGALFRILIPKARSYELQNSVS